LVRIASHIARSVVSQTLAIAAFAACLLAGEARAQPAPAPSPPLHQDRPQPDQPQQDRSFYLGTSVAHPEDLSGVWEAPDGHGGAVGIHLTLDTTAPVDATTLAGVTQSWLGLQVGLYHRSGAEIELGEENSFSDSPRGGGVRYAEGRLTLHAPGNASGYDLDLRRIPGDKWTGRFHRGDFDAVVTLARPTLQTDSDQPSSTQPWFVGSWSTSSAAGITCLHIAQQSPTAFIAWSDTLLAWGSVRFAPQVPKPPYSWEHYGDLVKIHSTQSGNPSIELGAYSALCCSHTFHATPADHGETMKADWPAGPNQSPHKSRWTKMPGNTCIPPAASRAAP
jgi:hypothetical protein